MAEKLSIGMSLDEVRQVAGNESFFRITHRNTIHGTGPAFGKERQDGEGEVGGTTNTTPPLQWSIEAEHGLNHERYAIGSSVSAAELSLSGILESTFTLRAIDS